MLNIFFLSDRESGFDSAKIYFFGINLSNFCFSIFSSSRIRFTIGVLLQCLH